MSAVGDARAAWTAAWAEATAADRAARPVVARTATGKKIAQLKRDTKAARRAARAAHAAAARAASDAARAEDRLRTAVAREEAAWAPMSQPARKERAALARNAEIEARIAWWAAEVDAATAEGRVEDAIAGRTAIAAARNVQETAP